MRLTHPCILRHYTRLKGNDDFYVLVGPFKFQRKGEM